MYIKHVYMQFLQSRVCCYDPATCEFPQRKIVNLFFVHTCTISNLRHIANILCKTYIKYLDLCIINSIVIVII